MILEGNTKNEEDIMKDIYEIVKAKFNLEILIFVWWVKTASVDIKDKITIRTANTKEEFINTFNNIFGEENVNNSKIVGFKIKILH